MKKVPLIITGICHRAKFVKPEYFSVQARPFINIENRASMKDQFKNTMTSRATYYLSFQDFIRYGREAISVVTELDTQLTEMRKVSNESL